jgi:hypothetical protein
MVRVAKNGNDPLLARVRRVLNRAEGLFEAGADSRRIRVMEIELRNLIAELKAGADRIGQEISQGARWILANKAYRNCLGLARRSSNECNNGDAR